MSIVRVISYGAGVQSTAVVLRSLNGELPLPDAVVFADTGWEPQTVYDTLEATRPLIEAAGVPLLIARTGNIREDALAEDGAGGRGRFAAMPLFTNNLAGERSMMRRQCTNEYKIRAIEKMVRSEVLGIKKRGRVPKDVRVEQSIGISTDEASRMKPNRRPWIDNVWPLCDMPQRGYPLFNRAKCKSWIDEHHPNILVAKSACIGCPFRSDAEWREMKIERPDDFADAVDFDNRIRGLAKMESPVYLHRSATPLGDVDFSNAADLGQGDLFDNECEGMCGV